MTFIVGLCASKNFLRSVLSDALDNKIHSQRYNFRINDFIYVEKIISYRMGREELRTTFLQFFSSVVKHFGRKLLLMELPIE